MDGPAGTVDDGRVRHAGGGALPSAVGRGTAVGPGTAGGPGSTPYEGSALYEGSVVHHRTGRDGGPTHRFRMPLAMLAVDLDEVAALASRHPLLRTGRGPAAIRLGRRDLPGDPDRPAAEDARRRAAGLLGRRPDGPVTLLTHPRTWGWQFNPITCAYCHDADGSVAALVAEVTNTPWHERTTYVLGPPGRHVVGKVMHVSPFLPMDVRYRFHYEPPGERLRLAVDVVAADDEERVLLRTLLSLRRRPADRAAIGRLLWHHRAMPLRVSAGIYAQAARLRLAGAVVHRHPERSRASASHGGSR